MQLNYISPSLWAFDVQVQALPNTDSHVFLG